MAKLNTEEASKGADRGGVASISKAFAILRLLGDTHVPLTMTEIARDTRLTPSSCHDLVTTLVQIGLVQASDVGKSYELGARIVKQAKMALTPGSDFSEAQRAMNVISDKHDANLAVYQPFGKDTYLSTHISEGNAPIRIRLSPGQSFPIFRGAPGRFFAAYGYVDPAEREAAFAAVGITGKQAIARFEAIVKEDATRGWATDDGETQRGVATIAVPILKPGRTILGVVELVMFSKQFEAAPVEAIAEETSELARMLIGHLAPR